MKLVEFCNTIGYSGNSAIVDKSNLKHYAKLSVDSLLEKGLYKQAFSKALFENSQEDLEKVLRDYNRVSGSSYSSVQEMKRLFGVFTVPEGISRVKAI